MKSMFRKIDHNNLTSLKAALANHPSRLNNQRLNESLLERACRSNKKDIATYLLNKGAYHSEDLASNMPSIDANTTSLIENDLLRRQAIKDFLLSQGKHGYLTSGILAPMLDYLARRQRETKRQRAAQQEMQAPRNEIKQPRKESKINEYLIYLQEMDAIRAYRTHLHILRAFYNKTPTHRMIFQLFQPSLINLHKDSITSFERLLGLKEKDEGNYQDRIIDIASNAPFALPDALPQSKDDVAASPVEYESNICDALCSAGLWLLLGGGVALGFSFTVFPLLALIAALPTIALTLPVIFPVFIGIASSIVLISGLITGTSCGLHTLFQPREPKEYQRKTDEAELVGEQNEVDAQPALNP